MTSLIYMNDSLYDISQQRVYRVGDKLSDDLTVIAAYADKLVVKDGHVIYHEQHYGFGQHVLALSDTVSVQLFVFEHHFHALLSSNIFSIGTLPEHTLRIDNSGELFIRSMDEGYEVISLDKLWVNGQLKETPFPIQVGDTLFSLTGYMVKLHAQSIEVFSLSPIETTCLPLVDDHTKEDKASDFHRSPRFILREPEDVVTILTPPTNDDITKPSLLKLLITPVAMITLTIVIQLLSGNGGMMLMMVGMSVITVFTSIYGFFTA